MTAAELLSAYSGANAYDCDAVFEYSNLSRITGVEVHAVGMQNTATRYSGRQPELYEVNNILRITTGDGFEGISGVDSNCPSGFNSEHFEELRVAAADIVALESLDPVEVSQILNETRRNVSDPVRASIDIALWDLAAKKAQQPLCKLLGTRRERIETYASLPFYETLPEYVDAVHRYAKHGLSAFKFHVWGSIERDLELVERLQTTFADSGYAFMIDLEGAYDIDDALRIGAQMDQGLFDWLEAPIDDRLLEEYAELRRSVATRIVPAGYEHYSPAFIRQGIELGSWDMGRFDATVVGGLSRALELLMIANAAGLPIEIQSWGHMLTQAVNLHLILSNKRTRFFEAPMPVQPFEFGMRNSSLLNNGVAVAPRAPGLGIEVDWNSLPAADFYRCAR